jgi:diguanylate cyclase (GGDEF)-like protein
VEYLETISGQKGSNASNSSNPEEIEIELQLESASKASLLASKYLHWRSTLQQTPNDPVLERPCADVSARPLVGISKSSIQTFHPSTSITSLWQQALSGTELPTLCHAALVLVTDHLQVQYGSIWQTLSDGNTLRRACSVGWNHTSIDCSEVSAYLNAQIKYLLQANQPTFIDHQTGKFGIESSLTLPPHARLEAKVSGINLPIPGATIALGFLELYSDTYRVFSDDEIDFIEAVAAVLAIAIQRKRSEELLQVQTQILEKIAFGASLPETFNTLCVLLESKSPTALCAIRLFDKTLNLLRFSTASSRSETDSPSLDGLPVAEGMGSCGTAAHRKTSVFVNDTAQDPLWENFQDLVECHNVRACWSSPFFARSGELLGTFSLSHSVPCEPTPHHVQILETATYLASIAVERHHAAETLKQQALHDALTGLPNRVFFMDQLKQRIQTVQTRWLLNEPPDQSYEFAVLFLDVDRFKLVNDSLGHTIGDQLLIEIVRLVKRCIRTKDTFARLGGDEFAILLETIEEVSQAQLIADRIRAVLSFPLKLNEHEVFTSVSIGIAHSLNGYTQPEELLRDADTAMYRAKTQGRANYEIFDKEMHTQALSRLHIEMDLRHVVEDLFFNNTSPLQLYYQPIISLSTGVIVGFEALIRWVHPERGFISPVEFIPVAEETGLIVPIGRWVLHEACNQLRRWQEKSAQAKDLIMSINVSSQQLLQPDFTSQISQILHATQISTSSIKLEITESVLMETATCVTDQLAQMQDLGIRLSLDDFGTGYSSLSYLYRFPINNLKVDRSFVDGLGNGQDQIVQTIIALAHGLGMDVTAEGVETSEQLARLKDLGCEFGQGYLFSRPVDQEAAELLFSQPPYLVE